MKNAAAIMLTLVLQYILETVLSSLSLSVLVLVLSLTGLQSFSHYLNIAISFAVFGAVHYFLATWIALKVISEASVNIVSWALVAIVVSVNSFLLFNGHSYSLIPVFLCTGSVFGILAARLQIMKSSAAVVESLA
jgi:hypothetical protein